jgi:transmembrane sensor
VTALASQPVRPEIRRQALEWIVLMWSGEVTPQQRHGLECWRAADLEHERAWQQVQLLGSAMQEIPAGLNSTLRNASPRNRRRTMLRCLAALAVTGAAGYGTMRSEIWLQWRADIRTARNERRELMLPDGTRLTLNGDSAVDLQFDEQARRILLRAGEVLIQTGHETGRYRPFSVQTPQGSVLALGTRFVVRRLDDGMSRVAVFDGAVEIRPVAGAAMPERLHGAEGADFSAERITRRFEADVLRTAWSRGLLIADRMRMDDFLRELSRYRSGVLRCDDSAAAMIVSGVYPLGDTDAVLDSLAQALPLQVSRITRYWVSVAKK